MTPRPIPCTECRRQSVKCLWASADDMTCLRCSKKAIPCSGPERKSPKPCVSCKRARAKCSKEKDTDCERCVRKGVQCIELPCAARKCGSDSSSSGSQSPVCMSPASERLSEQVALQSLDIQLALEGQSAIALLDRTCIFLHSDGLPIDRRAKKGISPIDNVVTMLFVLAGTRYTISPEIAGVALPSLTPSTRIPYPKSLLTPRRTYAVNDLSRRVLSALADLSRKSPSPDDLTRLISSIELAGMLCVMDGKDLESWRRMCAWGVLHSMSVLGDKRHPWSLEETKLLRCASAKLAFREGVESASVGRPSSISSTLYHLSCFSSSPSAQSVPLVTPTFLSPLFTPTLQPAILDPNLQHFLRDALLSSHLTRLVMLSREITRDLKLECRSRALDWWEALDACSSDLEKVLDNVLGDPRRYGLAVEERVVMATRSFSTTIDCCSELDLMICSAIITGIYGGRPTHDYLAEIARQRIRVYVSKAARRTGLILNGAHTSSPVEVLFPLYFLLRNLHRITVTDIESFHILSPVELEWTLRMLQYASFWEHQASQTSDAILESFSKLKLAEEDGDRTVKVAKKMVDDVLSSICVA